ncbi:MAG: F0F1 ATP synthase subunit epsilon [Loktanella sp.]|nr:F0F1 ATP synthase subunit epsilon [Loktanella sp.]
MANLQFDLVSPERRLASVVATEVRIPAVEGDMTAMANHVPTITTLRPGLLAVVHAGGTDEYVVSGGFAEINAESVSVLAEQALPRGEVSQDIFDQMVADAQLALTAAQADTDGDGSRAVDAAKVLTDTLAIGTAIGLTAKV